MNGAAPLVPARSGDRESLAPPGLLRVDKPAGVTSHDVVERVRRRLRAKGAGHLGTLDPGASGLLLVAIGAATRCVAVWQGGTKTYEAVARLGVVTDSQDMQGAVLETHDVRATEAEVRAASLALTGDLLQVPPMVSALRRGGERLYEIARRGETVERAPRPVRVESWEWTAIEPPLVSFRVRCSGGTYVRTLAHDLGAALGCGAALQALRRVRSEPFGVEGAVTLHELAALEPAAIWARAGVPLDEALAVLPALALDEAAAESVGRGGRPALARGAAGAAPLGAGPRSVVARDGAGRALALGELAPDPADGGRVLFCPHVVFPWAVREGRAGGAT